MELYLRTIQAVCHIEQQLAVEPDYPMHEDIYVFVWKYWTTGRWHFSIPNEIHCGDTITTDENGKILTVNGKEYVHVN
jgi:hypothetical protein